MSTPSRVLNRPIVRAFRTAPTGLFALAILIVLAVVAIVAPMLWSKRADTLHFTTTMKPPSWDHLLGTDQLGHDIFLRLLVAVRLSLELALESALIALVLGVTIGVTAALS